MVTTNDDPPESPDGISTSSSKGKDCLIFSRLRFTEELVYEVFLRLPVKSLIRFRCVSKGMRRLIDSPYFIKNHNILRSVMSESDREYAIFFHGACFPNHKLRLFSVSFENDDNNNLNHAKAISLDSTFVKDDSMEGTGWCCNGIFCFRCSSSHVFWNPSNGTFRKVDCSYCHVLSPDYGSMGYDCVNDDYKIIHFDEKKLTSLQVYSLRNDSWRTIQRDFPEGRLYDLYGFTRAVCLSGVMHWLWINYNANRSVFTVSIAAFDLATETFTSLPLPLEARKLQLRPTEFTDFGGRLSITFLPAGYPSRDHDGPQTVWVMEKYGVESSWAKLYDFVDEEYRIRNFYFPDMKRRLLCNKDGLSWWDPQDGYFEEIKIPMMPESYFYAAYTYVRNLIRLDQSWEPR